jgi:hypothetical protein
MSYDELEKTWRSPRNRPDPAHLDALQKCFLADLRRRRTGARIFVGLVFGALTFLSLRFLGYVFWPEPTQAPFDPRREWAPLLFLLVPWVGAVFLLRRVVRHEREHGHPERSVRAGVQALLDENRVSRARVKTAAWLHAVALVLLPLVVWQLRSAGKAGDEILVPAFVAWPLAVACIYLGLFYHHARKLVPRQRQLEELLRDYERT